MSMNCPAEVQKTLDVPHSSVKSAPGKSAVSLAGTGGLEIFDIVVMGKLV